MAGGIWQASVLRIFRLEAVTLATGVGDGRSPILCGRRRSQSLRPDASGMTLLCVQILLQIIIRSSGARPMSIELRQLRRRDAVCDVFPACRSGCARRRRRVFMGIYMPRRSLDIVTQKSMRKWPDTLLSIQLHPEGGGDRNPRRPGPYSRCTPGCIACRGGVATCLPAPCSRRCGSSPPPAGNRLGGIPEMRKRVFGGFAAHHRRRRTLGILLPPSITMILFAVAAEKSLGRCSSPASDPACCWSRCSASMR